MRVEITPFPVSVRPDGKRVEANMKIAEQVTFGAGFAEPCSDAAYKSRRDFKAA